MQVSHPDGWTQSEVQINGHVLTGSDSPRNEGPWTLYSLSHEFLKIGENTMTVVAKKQTGTAAPEFTKMVIDVIYVDRADQQLPPPCEAHGLAD